MIGIFQLVDGDDGTRSPPVQCTDLQFVEAIKAVPEENTERVAKSYVLCLMQQLGDGEEWNYSLFPLMGVSEFMALFEIKAEQERLANDRSQVA